VVVDLRHDQLARVEQEPLVGVVVDGALSGYPSGEERAPVRPAIAVRGAAHGSRNASTEVALPPGPTVDPGLGERGIAVGGVDAVDEAVVHHLERSRHERVAGDVGGFGEAGVEDDTAVVVGLRAVADVGLVHGQHRVASDLLGRIRRRRIERR